MNACTCLLELTIIKNRAVCFVNVVARVCYLASRVKAVDATVT